MKPQWIRGVGAASVVSGLLCLALACYSVLIPHAERPYAAVGLFAVLSFMFCGAWLLGTAWYKAARFLALSQARRSFPAPARAAGALCGCGQPATMGCTSHHTLFCIGCACEHFASDATCRFLPAPAVVGT